MPKLSLSSDRKSMKERFPGSLCWILIALLALGPARVHALSADLPRDPDPVQADAALRQGIQAYESLEYEQGILWLEGLLAQGDLPASRRKEALLYLALCQASLGRDEAGRRRFLELLEIDPDFRLDENNTSPKILRLFDLAREDFQNSIRGLDNLPPSLEERKIETPLRYHEPASLAVRALDDHRVQVVQVFLRKKGESTYDFYPMAEREHGWYEAEIPAHATDGEGVEYYILAADAAGNATMKGNAAFPLYLEVEPGPASKPWYKKWWVWAIIGAAAGAGAALGVTLSGGGSGSDGGNATLSIHLQ